MSNIRYSVASSKSGGRSKSNIRSRLPKKKFFGDKNDNLVTSDQIDEKNFNKTVVIGNN